MRFWIMAAASLGLIGVSQAALADGDATAGEAVFHKCALCHSADAGVNKVGPSLHAVVGRKSASIDGYDYSDALKAANKTWDPATLDQWLTNPREFVPGTKMVFPGLSKEKDRQDVIAYLETLK